LIDWDTAILADDENLLDDPDVTWDWQSYGFRTGKSSNRDGSSSTIRIIPYWSIVIPLTLLSAYLLLRKPNHPESRAEQKAT
jgi:hypothetical protein